MDTVDVLLTPQQAAERLNLTLSTLQRMRTEGNGPQFCKIGRRRIAYRETDIYRWVNERTASSVADARVRGLAAPYYTQR